MYVPADQLELGYGALINWECDNESVYIISELLWSLATSNAALIRTAQQRQRAIKQKVQPTPQNTPPGKKENYRDPGPQDRTRKNKPRKSRRP